MQLELRQKIGLELIISLALLAFYSFLYINADALIEESLFSIMDTRIFPKTILLCIIVLCTLLFIDTLCMWQNARKKVITLKMEQLVENQEEYPVGRIVTYIATLVIYSFGFYYIGFIYSTPIIMLFVAYLLGMKRFFLGAVGVIIFTLCLDYASLQFLQILLPQGVLFE